MRRVVSWGLGVVVALGFAFAASAQPQSLRIAFSADTTSIDPHFQDIGPNISVKAHIFDGLLNVDARTELVPALAESWTLTSDPTIWEFKLRRGVRFHDGSPFTARDVAFSLARAPKVPNAPSTFGRYLEDIAGVEIVDDHTLRVKTKEPSPILPMNLSSIAIVSARIGRDADPGSFNKGETAIGTGPFKFVEWLAGSHLKLAANPDYWGGRPRWDEVTIRPITNAGARVAALLAGDVDVIADVPPIDIARLGREPNLSLWRDVSNRVIFWTMDVFREQTPHVTAKDGSPIANPMRDVRVRRAFALAIDRNVIVNQVMEGIAQPAMQIVPPGLAGHRPDMQMPRADLAEARRLMAEAGHANGFKMTIHTIANRFPNDLKQAQTVAQMLSRLNLEVSLQNLSLANYFSEARRFSFSMMLVGWGFGGGNSYVVLRETLQTNAGNNYGRWSNPKVDELFRAARQEMVPQKRDAMLGEIQQIGLADFAVIPTHFQVNVWATRKGLRIEPRMDEATYAHLVTRVP
jgi:peptide/nickel transport system substrate-binding protein